MENYQKLFKIQMFGKLCIILACITVIIGFIISGLMEPLVGVYSHYVFIGLIVVAIILGIAWVVITNIYESITKYRVRVGDQIKILYGPLGYDVGDKVYIDLHLQSISTSPYEDEDRFVVGYINATFDEDGNLQSKSIEQPKATVLLPSGEEVDRKEVEGIVFLSKYYMP